MELIRKTKTLIIVGAFSLIVGCTSIDPIPFEQFNASLVELDKGATSSLNVTIPMAEGRYRKELVDELLQGSSTLLDQISVNADAFDPFFISQPPLFLSAQRFKQGISKTNMVWLEYSKLLVRLSSKELVDETEFKKLSTDLNSNAFDAIRSIKNGPGETTAKDTAIFSEIAIELAREFINTKRKEKLIESITENQKSIESYVDLMQKAVVTIAQSSTQEHSVKNQELAITLIGLAPSNVGGKNDVKIQKTLNDLIEVKQTHSAQMLSLQALHSAYGRIPEAHKALAKHLNNSNASIAAISALLEKGVQMHASYESKAKINKAELVQAKADAASSQATTVELKYQQAELKASQAQFNYTLAENALRADPDNDSMKKDTEGKKVIADELKLEAEILKESAVALRAAATAIQESATEVKNSITAN